METRPYFEVVADLQNIYLEDSYVLGIHEAEDALFFDLEAVLTEDHPAYAPPSVDMQYCYREARLIFRGSLKANWIERNFSSRSVDPDGSVDIGEIDGFVCGPDGYYLDGAWGAVQIRCDEVSLILRDTPLA
jgi:hypothetical protein